MRSAQRRSGIGILAIVAFVMFALAQSADAEAPSYDRDARDRDRHWTDEEKDDTRRHHHQALAA